MKKLLALLLAMLMLLSTVAMVACQDNTPSDPINPVPGDPEEPGDTEPEVSEDEEKANSVISRIEKIGDFTKANYKTKKTLIKNAREKYDALTDAQKAYISEELYKKLTDAEAAFAAYQLADEKAEALTINKLVSGSPRVDGVMNVEYYMGAAMAVATEGGAQINFHVLLDSQYLYILEVRADATPNYATDYNAPNTGDAAVIYFAKDAEQVSGLYWARATAKSETPVIALFGTQTEMASATVKEYDCVAVNSDGGYVMEAKIPLKDLGLTSSDFDKSLVGMTYCAYDANGTSVAEMKYAGVDAWDDCERFFTADSFLFKIIAEGTPVIDGRLDDIYKQAQAIELSQTVCNSFSDGEKAVGAGFVGIENDGSSDAILQLSGNMFATFRLVIDDEYIYISEHRYDLIPLYKNKTFREPYKADGSMFWFTLDGSVQAGIQWNRSTLDSTKPMFGLFYDDKKQNSSSLMDWEYAVKNCGNEFEYIMECKIPLSDLKLTKEDFDKGRVGFTCITCDIVKSDYNPDNFAWKDAGFQMQYVGVNNWKYAPALLINPFDRDLYDLPVVGEYDPSLDPDDSGNEKPFDKVPVDENGFLTIEYRYMQYATWFSDMKREEYIFTKDPMDKLPEGMLIVDTPTGNTNVGKYCDQARQFVIKIDLKKYKDAIIVMELAQNYHLEVSTDAAVETTDAAELGNLTTWTVVQDYETVHKQHIESGAGSLHHAVAIEASTWAENADYLYIRLSNCDPTKGHGGSCYNFTIYYKE